MSSDSDLVQRLSPKLTGKQRRQLRALGHALQPVLMVGQRGFSPTLLENFQAQLLAHELIKVKVHDLEEMDEIAQQLHDASGAQLAQKIGKMLLFYQAHPDKPRITLD